MRKISRFLLIAWVPLLLCRADAQGTDKATREPDIPVTASKDSVMASSRDIQQVTQWAGTAFAGITPAANGLGFMSGARTIALSTSANRAWIPP